MKEDEDIVLLSRCGSVMEADMVTGILGGAGIKSFTGNSGFVSVYFGGVNPNSYVDVYVRKEDANLAAALLNAKIENEEENG